MDKQTAAEILTEQAQLEEDIELKEALAIAIAQLQEDTLYHWVEGDLKDWLEDPHDWTTS